MDPIKCLDHGFVELVDAMGDDQSILRAARVSYAKEEVVRSAKDDRALIRYLMRMRHTTPFESVVFVFHMKMPIFVARQAVRHRMSSINEVSARYTELPQEFYTPMPEHVQYQATTNKQGRSGVMDDAAEQSGDFNIDANSAFESYRRRLDAGMAKELARINLPLSTYTRWHQKFDLHNLFHFLGLRLDKHAQYEIRVFAEAMAFFVKDRCPLAWEAFEDFRLNAMSFSAVELKVLRRMMKNSVDLFVDHEDRLVVPSVVLMSASVGCVATTWIEDAGAEWPTAREREEFVAKIKTLLASD
jgi:thymidylate synthase (FAD)